MISTKEGRQHLSTLTAGGGGGGGGFHHPTTKMRHVPTGLPVLDHALRGGLRVGTITELVGRAGTGKTQLAMQLCVMAARYSQGCIYIDTEKKLSLPRLREIAEQRQREAVAITTTDNDTITNYHNNTFASASTLPENSIRGS